MKRSQSTTASNDATPVDSLLVRIVKEGALIGLVAISVYLMLALLTYDPGDPGWSHTGENSRIRNAGGPAGAWLADVFLSLFGYLAYLFPVLLAYRAWQVFRDRERQPGFDWLLISLRIVGLILVMVAGTAIASMHYPDGVALPFSTGGLLGASVAEGVEGAFSYTGGTLILLAVFLFGITIFTDLSWLGLMDEIGRITLLLLDKVHGRWQQWQRRRAERKAAKAAQQHRREAVAKQVNRQTGAADHFRAAQENPVQAPAQTGATGFTVRHQGQYPARG